LRAFIALEISGGVLDSLVEFQSEIAATGADVKLVEKENLHFTLKFLGEISEAQAAEAGTRLSKLALQGGEVEIRGAGAFPNASRPRVLWAGVARENESLVETIASHVIDSLHGIGQRDDRPFSAHVTLGRVRSMRNARSLGGLLRENSDRPFGSVNLSHLKLKSSVLTPGGPVYSDLGAYQLA
jgi:2'-5' RNA ligase